MTTFKPGIANPTYTPLPPSPVGYSTFKAFYPYYLGEHNNKTCRRLHLVGTSVSFGILARITASLLPLAFPQNDKLDELRLHVSAWKLALGGLAQGYFLAWVGHFAFEKNKPATFKYPLFSFMGDIRMLWEVVTLKRSP